MDWQRFRDLMPARPGQINLNAGTLSPTPRPVAEATNALRDEMACNGTYFFWEQLPPLLVESRRRLAAFLNVGPERLLLLANVTFAMNLATAALPLGEGDEVVVTDQMYGAMRMALQRRARRVGARIKTIALPPDPASPEAIVARFAAAIGPRTTCLYFDHATSPTGLVLPAADLCALARERGCGRSWTARTGRGSSTSICR